MKKLSKLFGLFFLTFASVSCGGSTNDDVFLYKSDFNHTGTYFESYQKSQEDTTLVYEGVIAVRNESEKDLTISKEDITMKIGDKSYTCLFFATKTAMESLNGNTVNYIAESEETITFQSSESEMYNLLPCFEIDGGSNFTYYYKNTALKAIGE